MNWLIWLLITVGIFTALVALSATVRGIILSLTQLIWAGIVWLGKKIGVPTILIFIGVVSVSVTLFILFLGIGYANNWNWLLQPLLFFNMLLLLLTVVVTRLRGLALIFMFLCTILLFAEADIIIFKAHLDLIAGFTLFCLFFVALGTYLKKPSNIPGYFLMLVFTISILFSGYTHINKDLWEAQRDVLLAKRDIETQNTNALAGTLGNDWKFGIIRPQYKIVLADDNGKIIKNPKFPIAENGKVLVYSKPNPTIPKKVGDLFRQLPVYQITDAGFETQTTYWILQANIEILKKINGDEESKTEKKQILESQTRIETEIIEHPQGTLSYPQNLCPNWTQVTPEEKVELILVPPHTYKEYLIKIKGGKVKFKNSKGNWDIVSQYDTKNIQSRDKNGLCCAYYHSGNPEIKVTKIF